jgi:hypothetical protein
MHESLDDAKYAAVEEAYVSERAQGIWVVGPGLYSVDPYRKGDENRQGFVERVEPCQTAN